MRPKNQRRENRPQRRRRHPLDPPCSPQVSRPHTFQLFPQFIGEAADLREIEIRMDQHRLVLLPRPDFRVLPVEITRIMQIRPQNFCRTRIPLRLATKSRNLSLQCGERVRPLATDTAPIQSQLRKPQLRIPIPTPPRATPKQSPDPLAPSSIASLLRPL